MSLYMFSAAGNHNTREREKNKTLQDILSDVTLHISFEKGAAATDALLITFFETFFSAILF